jgi:hypothetical protein
MVWLLSLFLFTSPTLADLGFDDKYKRLQHPMNDIDPNNPLNPINHYNPDMLFHPLRS